MNMTVIGASGFIGRNLIHKLSQMNLSIFTPNRDDPNVFRRPLGHVIYCAGLTADYRKRPFDTVKAHVTYLADILEKAQFDSFLYLSSTRVYINNTLGDVDSDIKVNPNDSEYIFNISKLMGESLCISQYNPAIRIVRLSNVFGDDYYSENFLFSIIRDAVDKGEIVLQTTFYSAKDYIYISDVVELLIKISYAGKERIYNVASGINVSNKDIVNQIREITGCSVNVISQPKHIVFPVINISATQKEFEFKPQSVLDLLPDLVMGYKNIAKK